MSPASNRFQNIYSRSGGFSILEMMIAMAVLVLSIGAAVLVSFGNQSLISDSETNIEAISLAQKYLEKAQADARKDFKLVNSTTTTEGMYHINLSVASSTDYYAKLVTAQVSWMGDQGRAEHVDLSVLVTNHENAVGGDSCSSELFGNWAAPTYTVSNFSGAFISPVAGTVYPLTDLDVYKNKMYVTVNNNATNTNPTFFVFTIPTLGSTPVYQSSVDNSTVSAGLNAVQVAGNYAYVATGYGAPYSTCSQSATCAQLQIFNIANNPPTLVSSYKIPGVTGAGGQAIGKSIFYKDGYVYLGLSTTLSGPEFNIIDVHTPTAPSLMGGYSVGNAVNALYIKGRYAYLATPHSQELKVLDISDLTNPVTVGGFDAPDAAGNGKSVYTVGDTLYLGRTVTASNPELYVVNISTPTTISSTAVGTKEISSSVNSLIVRNYLAFLLTNNQLQILRIDDPANITVSSTFSLPGSSAGVALDCEGNYMYAASVDGSNAGYITLIKPGP